MLFGWKTPYHMRSGLGQSRLAEIRKFYHDYLDAMYPSPDDEESDEAEVPWEAETVRGDLV